MSKQALVYVICSGFCHKRVSTANDPWTTQVFLVIDLSAGWP